MPAPTARDAMKAPCWQPMRLERFRVPAAPLALVAGRAVAVGTVARHERPDNRRAGMATWRSKGGFHSGAR